MALALTHVRPQCVPCLVSYRMQRLVRSLDRGCVLSLICLVPCHPANQITQGPMEILHGNSSIPGALLFTVVVAQGAGPGDATTNTLFGDCRGFLKAEEGAKGLPHLHALCQSKHSKSLTNVSFLPVSESAFLMWLGKI